MFGCFCFQLLYAVHTTMDVAAVRERRGALLQKKAATVATACSQLNGGANTGFPFNPTDGGLPRLVKSSRFPFVRYQVFNTAPEVSQHITMFRKRPTTRGGVATTCVLKVQAWVRPRRFGCCCREGYTAAGEAGHTASTAQDYPSCCFPRYSSPMPAVPRAFPPYIKKNPNLRRLFYTR